MSLWTCIRKCSALLKLLSKSSIDKLLLLKGHHLFVFPCTYKSYYNLQYYICFWLLKAHIHLNLTHLQVYSLSLNMYVHELHMFRNIGGYSLSIISSIDACAEIIFQTCMFLNINDVQFGIPVLKFAVS